MCRNRLLASSLLLASSSLLPAQVERAEVVYGNFDLRDPELRAATGPTNAGAKISLGAEARYRAKLSPERAARLAAMRAAAGEFLATPGRVLVWNRAGTVPEGVYSLDGSRFLTPASTAPRESIARGFLQANSALYGLTKEEIDGLAKFTDYTNPAGNMSWVEFRQEFHGLPVFGAEIRLGFTRDHALAGTTGNLVPALDTTTLDPRPKLSPATAAVAAAASIGHTVDAVRFATKSVEQNGRLQLLARGPFVREVKTGLVWFSPEPGAAVLAYTVELWEKTYAYYLVVDAADGTILWRKNITEHQTQPATYGVYTGTSPAPLPPNVTAVPGTNYQAPGATRQTVTLIGNEPPNTFNTNGWITDGGNVTTGNNVNAGLDIDGSNGIDSGGQATGSPSRVFNFTYSPPPLGSEAPTLAEYRKGVTTNLFYWTNVYHDRLYLLGFTETARNFQTNNFGRGGSQNDAVLAEVQDSGGTNNANFSTPADGSAGRMQMYLFTGPTPQRDGSLDADVFLHELTHGTSNRLHGNGGGLSSRLARGMGEGWSDFYARCILATPAENVNGVFPSGSYVTLNLTAGFTDNYYYGIRRFPYAPIALLGPNGRPHSPRTLADLDPAQMYFGDGAYSRGPVGSLEAMEVHNVGEIWCDLMLEARALLISRLGFAIGNQRALQIATDAMKLDVTNPTPLSSRDTLIAAALAANPGAVGLADANDIRVGFARRGAGSGASLTTGSNGSSCVAVESYLPDLTNTAISFTDSLGNSNTYAEPGEDLILSVSLRNPGSSAATATAALGAASADFGSIAAAATVVRTLPYRVPAATAAGALLTLPIAVTSPAGVGYVYYTLRVGRPVSSGLQNFDGVTAPALPNGWTSTVSAFGGGVAGTAWNTQAGAGVDAANAAFAPDISGNGTAGGESCLVSPVIALPAENTSLSFKHRWTFDTSGNDGGVLEISIAGGAFTDIIAAGGTFAGGGYPGSVTNQSPARNPLNRRNAWITTGATTTTTVHLPSVANGQNVQLRWRLGFDHTGAATGWFVDTISQITYVLSPIDNDGDGIPDGWETAYGLNPALPSDASTVDPRSGFTYLEEYLAGMNPTDPATFLRVVSQSRDSGTGDVTVAFQSVNGRTYLLERSADLGGSWTPVGSVINGTGTVLNAVDPAVVGEQMFYRIRAVVP